MAGHGEEYESANTGEPSVGASGDQLKWQYAVCSRPDAARAKGILTAGPAGGWESDTGFWRVYTSNVLPAGTILFISPEYWDEWVADTHGPDGGTDGLRLYATVTPDVAGCRQSE